MGLPGDGAVEVTLDGAVAVITLQREHKCNALSAHMESRLLESLDSDPVRNSRAVVITGGPTVFSAGADVTELQEMTTQDVIDYYGQSGAVYEKFAALPQPTVAAIAGYCLGGGLELSLAADVRIADATAVFGFPEICIGILPSSGGITRAQRLFGAGRARDLIMRGRRFNADDAERWGVVSEVVRGGGHIRHAVAVGQHLASLSPATLRVTKQVLDVAQDAPTHAALLLEQLAFGVLNSLNSN